jgi:hypothetical protein
MGGLKQCEGRIRFGSPAERVIHGTESVERAPTHSYLGSIVGGAGLGSGLVGF